MARKFGNGENEEENNDGCKGASGGNVEPKKPVPVPVSPSISPTPTTDECGEGQAQPSPIEEIREEAEEGQHLYLNFVLTEIRRLGLSEPPSASQFQEADSAIINHLAPDRYLQNRRLDWTRAGRELRAMADAFARSTEREAVRKRAESIELCSFNAANFLELLQELFQGDGVTRERIIVLFFFCADIAIEAVKRGLNTTFQRLMQCSLKYITTRVAHWVHRHGGWAAVLSSTLDVVYQVSACCAFIAVAVACAIYVRRNL